MGIIKKYKKIDKKIYHIYTRRYVLFWRHTSTALSERTAKLVCKYWYK